jgi:cysteine desulfurase/selenocysteine lyase
MVATLMPSKELNIASLRKDFPVLDRLVRGKPLVYLDNAATTQKPRVVIDALSRYYEEYNANVHRGVHTLSQEATEAMEAARGKVASFLGTMDPATVIFTRNATEAINLVALSWGRKNLRAGDEILLSEMEHHANLVPWQMLAQSVGVKLRFLPVNGNEGLLDLSRLDELLTAKTKLVALTQMSNVLGTINPVQDIAQRAHAVGAKMLVDGAQSAPHLGVNVGALGADFFVLSAHKMMGPTGIGVLWARRDILEGMDPLLGGGDMIKEVWLERATWNELPFKFEAGTPDIGGAIAFGAAVDYLTEIGPARLRDHEVALTRRALTALRERFPDVILYGPRDAEDRGGVVSFNLPGAHPHDVGTILDREGVAVRAGHHCAQPLMRRLGIPGTARASFYLYNTPEEVDIFVDALGRVRELFR